MGSVWNSSDLTAPPTVTMGNGDGTVHHASLRICEDWVGSVETYETTVKVWDNVSHTGFQKNAEALKQIVAIATSNSTGA